VTTVLEGLGAALADVCCLLVFLVTSTKEVMFSSALVC